MAYVRPFIRIEREALTLPLSGTSFRVLLCLRDRTTGRWGEQPTVYMSVDEIAERVEISRRGVQKAIAQLRAHGLLISESTARSNRYRFGVGTGERLGTGSTGERLFTGAETRTPEQSGTGTGERSCAVGANDRAPDVRTIVHPHPDKKRETPERTYAGALGAPATSEEPEPEEQEPVDRAALVVAAAEMNHRVVMMGKRMDERAMGERTRPRRYEVPLPNGLVYDDPPQGPMSLREGLAELLKHGGLPSGYRIIEPSKPLPSLIPMGKGSG